MAIRVPLTTAAVNKGSDDYITHSNTSSVKYEYAMFSSRAFTGYSAPTIIAKSSWNAAENGCECTLSSLQKPS